MAISPDYRDLLSAFNGAEVRYLVVGAHAVSFHAEPRFTVDLDLWIQATLGNARKVRSALSAFGAPLRRIAVKDFATPGLVYQIGVEPVRIDILTSIAGVEFRDAYRSRIECMYGDIPIPIISIEHLIAAKKAAGRPQDLLDLNALLMNRRGRR